MQQKGKEKPQLKDEKQKQGALKKGKEANEANEAGAEGAHRTPEKTLKRQLQLDAEDMMSSGKRAKKSPQKSAEQVQAGILA